MLVVRVRIPLASLSIIVRYTWFGACYVRDQGIASTSYVTCVIYSNKWKFTFFKFVVVVVVVDFLFLFLFFRLNFYLPVEAHCFLVSFYVGL